MATTIVPSLMDGHDHGGENKRTALPLLIPSETPTSSNVTAATTNAAPSMLAPYNPQV
jgi:hypothetical protein